MAIDHTSLSRRRTVPPPGRDTSNIWAPITFFFPIYYVETFLLILSPSCFAVCEHRLAPRIAIVFSLLSTVMHQASPCHIHLFSSSLNPSRSSSHVSHSPTTYVSSTLYCFAPGAHLCIFFLLPRLLVYLFFLAGPCPLHEIAVSAFSRSPLGRANTFSFLFLLLTPRKSL